MALKKPWQRYRLNREKKGFKDRGRIAFRFGSYGLSFAVTVVSFLKAMPPAGTQLLSDEWIWRIALMGMLGVAWFALIYAEFPPRKAARERLSKTNRAAKTKHVISKG